MCLSPSIESKANFVAESTRSFLFLTKQTKQRLGLAHGISVRNSNLAESYSPITSLVVVQSLRTLAQITLLKLPCSGQNFRTIVWLKISNERGDFTPIGFAMAFSRTSCIAQPLEILISLRINQCDFELQFWWQLDRTLSIFINLYAILW